MDLKLPTFFGFLITFVNSQMTFREWLYEYNISHSSNFSEFNKRRQAFDISASFVTVNKLKYNFDYELGLNCFADVPFQDFLQVYNGLVLPDPSNRGDSIILGPQPILSYRIVTAIKTPTSVDYRNYSLPVLHQKQCNSCWAFSVVSALGALKVTAYKISAILFNKS
jgi:hypothetical protein